MYFKPCLLFLYQRTWQRSSDTVHERSSANKRKGLFFRPLFPAQLLANLTLNHWQTGVRLIGPKDGIFRNGLAYAAPITSHVSSSHSHSYHVVLELYMPRRTVTTRTRRRSIQTYVVMRVRSVEENVYYIPQCILLYNHTVPKIKPPTSISYTRTDLQYDFYKRLTNFEVNTLVRNHDGNLQNPRHARLQQPLQVPYPHRSSRARGCGSWPHGSSSLHEQCAAFKIKHNCFGNGMFSSGCPRTFRNSVNFIHLLIWLPTLVPRVPNPSSYSPTSYSRNVFPVSNVGIATRRMRLSAVSRSCSGVRSPA